MFFEYRVFILRYHFKNILMMKSYFCSITLLFALTCQTFAQAKPFPAGVYKSLVDLQRRQPAVAMPGHAEALEGMTFTNGDGYAFRIVPDNLEVHPSFIRNTVFAYSTGDDLFLNSPQICLFGQYMKVMTYGRYLTFVGGPVNVNKLEYTYTVDDAIGNVASRFLLPTTSIDPFELFSANKQASSYSYYVLDIGTGILKRLNGEMLPNLLSWYPSLLENFEKEKDKANPEIYFQYIQKVNDMEKTEASLDLLKSSKIPRKITLGF